ncbi:MAG: DMT family transporter [Halobacteriovoraceae bacterium]|nr:DMT family transporter [Halobacteriovoraceae bacterium]MCB9095493.1 DMT family transporter [Halobacteriovoraceae bacterium]
MNNFGLYILTIIASIFIGALMPMQSVVNSQLARSLDNHFHSAFVSFFVGASIFFIITMFFSPGYSEMSFKKVLHVSPWYLTGGILGALFVLSSLFLVSRIGATVMMGSFITGQLCMSLIIDHFGIMGIPTHPLNFFRIVGVLFLFLGLGILIKN